MTTGEKLFIEGYLDEAYEALTKEAAAGNGRALYLLSEYAKHTWLSPVDWKLAERLAKEGAAAGDVLAEFNVGYALPLRSEEQRAYFERMLPKVRAMAEAGDVLAMYEMAGVYADNILVPRDDTQRWQWNERCAKAGLWIGRSRMGSLYLWADGEMESYHDEEKGIALMTAMAAEQRKSAGEAAHLLADHYMYTGDLAKSYPYSRLSADWENPYGYFFLARHYMLGEMVDWSFPKALELFKKTYNSRCELAGNAATYIGNIYFHTGEKEKAVRWYRKAADAGDNQGLVELGKCYENGQGVAVDRERALSCYQKAYDRKGAGHIEAAFRLACAMDGADSEKEKRLAIEAAEAGYWEAMLLLIHYYTEVEVDFNESLRWGKAAYDMAGDDDPYKGELANHIAACYNRLEDLENCLLWAKKAADRGIVSAMYEYAHMLYETDGTPPALKEARTWFTKYSEEISKQPTTEETDAAIGDASNLAGMCCTRLGELEAAFPWFEKAVHYNDPFGMMNLGGLYLGMSDDEPEKLDLALKYFMMSESAGKEIFDDQAKGIAASQISICYRKMEDEKNCFYWANKSASYRCEVGMIDLGMLYAKGIGTLKDLDKAAQWLTAAYEIQGPQAGETANYLGLLYEEKKDFKTAAQWFEKAADLGHEWGMFNLASHYESGDLADDGVPSYKDALFWYEKALACGGEAVKDAEEGISRTKAALEGNTEEEPALPAIDLKQFYMPWLSTMKWGSKGE